MFTRKEIIIYIYFKIKFKTRLKIVYKNKHKKIVFTGKWNNDSKYIHILN